MWAPVYYTTGENGYEATASAKLQDETTIPRYCPTLRSVSGIPATDANRVVEGSNITRVILDFETSHSEAKSSGNLWRQVRCHVVRCASREQSAVVQGLHYCLDEIVMGQGSITSAVPELVFR